MAATSLFQFTLRNLPSSISEKRLAFWLKSNGIEGIVICKKKYNWAHAFIAFEV